jgi:glycine cleavage system regulatory protein
LAEIAGTFAGVVVVEVGDDRVDELLTNLLVLREQGLHVTAQQVEEPVVAPDADEVRLRLTGDDRPGIVHEISTAINDAGISISRLGTVTDLSAEDGGRGFEITAQLTVPVEVDLDAVLDSIGEVAVRLGIALHVEDLTGDDAGE